MRTHAEHSITMYIYIRLCADSRCESVPKDKPKHIKNCSTIYIVPTSYHRPFRFQRTHAFSSLAVVVYSSCRSRYYRHCYTKPSIYLSFIWMRWLFALCVCPCLYAFEASFFAFVCDQYKYDVIRMLIERRRSFVAVFRCSYCYCHFLLQMLLSHASVRVPFPFFLLNLALVPFCIICYITMDEAMGYVECLTTHAYTRTTNGSSLYQR